MDAQQVIELIDSYWFEQKIISSSPPSPPPPTPSLQIPKEYQKPELSCLQSRHVRSFSEELSSQTSFISEYDSPTSVLPTQCKLQTILSGKETPNIEEVAERKPKVGIKRRNRGNNCKSLTDLEFEELKGFMDLGFVFCEEDKNNTSLVSVVPGIQRLGKEEDEGREEEVKKMVTRPYLSEAWEVRNHRKGRQNPLMMNWNFPSLSDESEMKNHLRCWAHTVATAVR